MNGVVPFAMNCVGLQIDMGELFLRDLSPNGVSSMIRTASHFHALGGRCPGDQPHHRLVIAQWFSAPVG